MERPTDSYKETHNITLSLEDTLFGGQVSNLQVLSAVNYFGLLYFFNFSKLFILVYEHNIISGEVYAIINKLGVFMYLK